MFDKTEAEAGETVTVMVECEDKYVFEGLTANPQVSFAMVEEGKKYTFVMPASDVTIGATFTRSIPSPASKT